MIKDNFTGEVFKYENQYVMDLFFVIEINRLVFMAFNKHWLGGFILKLIPSVIENLSKKDVNPLINLVKLFKHSIHKVYKKSQLY